MLVSLASLLQQQSGKRLTRIHGLKNGLKSPGCWRFPVDITGMKKGAKSPVFNDLQNSMEFYRIKIGAGDESRTRDLNLGKVALYQLSYSRMGTAFFSTALQLGVWQCLSLKVRYST